MILAYVTLPYRDREFTSHGYGETLLPADALIQRIRGVSGIFGIPKKTIRDAHFQHNQQWAYLCTYTTRRNTVAQSPLRLGKVSKGTFEEDTIFFRNAKHLGLRMPGSVPTESTHRENEKVREIILSCRKLISVTLYWRKPGGQAKAYYEGVVQAVIAEVERLTNGSRSIRLCVVKKGGSVEQLK